MFDHGCAWYVSGGVWSRAWLEGVAEAIGWGLGAEIGAETETDWRRFSETYRMDTYGGLGFSSLENGFQAQKGIIERWWNFVMPVYLQNMSSLFVLGAQTSGRCPSQTSGRRFSRTKRDPVFRLGDDDRRHEPWILGERWVTGDWIIALNMFFTHSSRLFVVCLKGSFASEAILRCSFWQVKFNGANILFHFNDFHSGTRHHYHQQ